MPISQFLQLNAASINKTVNGTCYECNVQRHVFYWKYLQDSHAKEVISLTFSSHFSRFKV